jgi:DNA-binding GntR family transcriptional regulator
MPEWIRNVLETRITVGELEPGERIGLKADLQDQFDVSCSTLDQALKLLDNDGLVTCAAGQKRCIRSPGSVHDVESEAEGSV